MSLKVHLTKWPMKSVFLSDLPQPESSSSMNPPEGHSQLGWEEQGPCGGSDLQGSYEDSAPLLLDRLHSLAEAEKLFDELTQEKLQVSARSSSHHTASFPLVSQDVFLLTQQRRCTERALCGTV